MKKKKFFYIVFNSPFIILGDVISWEMITVSRSEKDTAHWIVGDLITLGGRTQGINVI